MAAETHENKIVYSEVVASLQDGIFGILEAWPTYFLGLVGQVLAKRKFGAVVDEGKKG